MSFFDKSKKNETKKYSTFAMGSNVGKRNTLKNEGEGAGTTIGINSKIKGELNANEDVIIEGKINGNIKVEKDLTINPNGDVKAKVIANSVFIKGKIKGDIVAKSRVEILSSGYLEGNISAPAIIISEGAFFKGNVDMGQSSEEKGKDVKTVIETKTPKIGQSPLVSISNKSKPEKKD